MPELYAALTVLAVAGLGLVALRHRGRWLGRIASFLFLSSAFAGLLLLIGRLPAPPFMLAVPWPAFVAGAATGAVVVWRFLVVRVRTGVKVKNPLVAWRSLNPHEVSFLRRIWRVGFILEEDDALRQERPERVNATIHGLEETRRLIYLDRVRGSSGNLRAYRLTAAGKDLMTWVTNQRR